MELWLDTNDINAIKSAVKLGILAGVTTNPAIFAQANRESKSFIKDLLHYQEGPVAVQVTATDTHEMVQQGQTLYAFSNRIVVKIPLTKNGLEAIHLLSRQGISTMATIVFYPHQALLAAQAGAQYIAPYVGRIERAGRDPWEVLQNITKILQNYRLKSKILGASIQSIDQIINCASIGIYGVTLKESLFDQLTADDPETLAVVQAFQEHASVGQITK